jgi:hypothetical protein
MGWLMNTAESDCCSNGRCVAAVFLDTDVTSRIAARCRPVSRIDHGARRSDGCLQRGSRFLLFRSGSDLNNEVPAGEGMRVFDVFALLCKTPCFANSRTHFFKAAIEGPRYAKSGLENSGVEMYLG